MADEENHAEEYHPQRTPSPSSPTPDSQPFLCGINRALLPIKGYYFVFMSAVGDLLPFIALYMRQLGLTSHETGIIYGIMPFVGFFIRPFFGAVADKFKKHKLMLVLMTVLTGLSYFLLVVVPSRPDSSSGISIHTKLECNTQDSFVQDCQDMHHLQSCGISLSHYANSSAFRDLNNSVMCTVSCQLQKNSKPPEFEACFTNDTGPYNHDRCNGTLSHSRHLNFAIPDLAAVIASEIPKDRFQIRSLHCWDYNLKDILFMQNFEREAFQILCEKEVSLECVVDCSQDIKCEQEEQVFDETFFLFFFIFLMANIFFAPIFPLLDAAAYGILGEQRALWGKQRIWGTFGFALFAVTSTFIMYMQSQNNEINYKIIFYLFLPLCITASVIAGFMGMSSDIKCSQFVRNVCKLLSHKEVFAFLFVVMYFGILTGGLEAFLFWYLMGLGSSPLVFGFILLANSTAEMPMLWVAGAIIKRTGLVACLYLALFCYALRLLVYSVLENPWLVLLVEPCHGVTFALMYAAASSYASIISPPGMSATVQGLLGGVHFGFGKGIGSLITGFLFEALGPRWTWGLFAIISIVLLLLYGALNVFIFKSHNRPLGLRQPAEAEMADEEMKQEDTLISDSSTQASLDGQNKVTA